MQSDRRELAELLAGFRKERLAGADAQRAWSQPEARSFLVGKMTDGSRIHAILRVSREGVSFLQEFEFPGWTFSRLVPKEESTP